MFQDVLMDFSWASLLLLAGYAIRAKVKVFQKAYIPVAVIAGLLGLLLGPEVLGKVSPVCITWSENVSSYANPLLAILFVSQFLTLRVKLNMIQKCSLVFLISGVVMSLQVLLAMPMARMFGVPDGFAILPFLGFYGAHGLPGLAAGLFENAGYWNFDEANSVGTTFATIGLLFGIIGGIIIINIAARKNWVVSKKVGMSNMSEEDLTGYIPTEKRSNFMSGITSGGAVDPLAFHFAIVGAVMVLGYLLLAWMKQFSIFANFAIQIPAIVIALIVDIISSKTKLGEVMDGASLARIGCTALEYLIIISVATTNLTVVMQYGLPIIVMSIIILAVTTILCLGLSKLWLKKNWVENGMVMFGSWTGSTATGLMLLRVADPDMQTDAGPNLIAATPFWQLTTQSFFMMAAPLMLVSATGFTNLFMIAAAIVVSFTVIGFLIARKA